MVDYRETRFERRGGPPDLPAAFAAFVNERLYGRSLDENHAMESAEGEFPDFGAFRDLVLIEMKHLEDDQEERLNTVLDEKIDPNERPIFFGQRQIKITPDDFSNADEILHALFSKLSRSIEGILRKANRQFESYRKRNPRKNALNICLVLNSKVMEFTPEVVAKAIHSKMKARSDGESRFASIDAVVYISEKHFMKLPDGRLAHAVLIYEGMSAVTHGWKVPIIDRIVEEWSWFRTGGKLEFEDGLPEMGTVEDIPDSMSRSDVWLLEYARNPYLQPLDLAELRVWFHRLMAVNSLTFLKDEWPKPPKEETAEGLRLFQHLIAETNRRGTDMREMNAAKLTAAEREIVIAGLPSELVDMLYGPTDRGDGQDPYSAAR